MSMECRELTWHCFIGTPLEEHVDTSSLTIYLKSVSALTTPLPPRSSEAPPLGADYAMRFVRRTSRRDWGVCPRVFHWRTALPMPRSTPNGQQRFLRTFDLDRHPSDTI